MERSIVHEFEFTAECEQVWKYLTDSELLAAWLMPNDFKLALGHQFAFVTKPKIKLGFDGTVYCKVLEIIENEKLVFSWRGGQGNEKNLLDSVVTFTLKASNKGCILRLEHRGFKGIRNWLPYIIMNKGWEKIGKRLLNLIYK